MEQLSDASKTLIAKRPNQTRDRLSDLPDLALVHILSHLYFQQAAKTTILSKRFNSLWNSVSNLSFSDKKAGKYGESFTKFVDTALSFHSRNEIDRFSVKFGYDFTHKASVDKWIEFAVQRKVKSLCLHLNKNRGDNRVQIKSFKHDLPEFLCQNDYLVELIVRRCKFSYEGSFNWNSLRLLSIKRIRLDEELITRVLSGSPVLETLELINWSGFDKLKIESVSLRVLRIVDELRPNYIIQPKNECLLEISGPNLVSLEVSGSLYRTKLRLSDLGCLRNATMDFEFKPMSRGLKSSWYVSRDQDLVRELLEGLCLVNTLTLGVWCIKALSSLEAYNLSSPWSERRSLTLCIPVIDWDHRGIASLLQSSPSLETLVIRLSYCSEIMCVADHVLHNICDEEYYWKSWSTISKCPVLHLKTVKIIGVRESCRSMKPLFQFLEFLLRHSRALKEVVIQTSRFVTRGTKTEALKLLDVPTASPDAVVQFEPPRLWVDTFCM